MNEPYAPIWISSLITILLSTSVWSPALQGATMDNRELYAKTRNAIDKLDTLKEFRAVVDKDELFPGYKQYYCQSIRNGKTLVKIYYANDKLEPRPNGSTSLTNEDGNWLITNTHLAILKKFETSNPPLEAMANLLDCSPDNKFSSEPTEIAGEPGIVVTETFTDDFKSKLTNHWSELRTQISLFSGRSMTLAGAMYWIRSRDGLLIKRRLFEDGGKTVYEHGWRNIDEAPNFPDNFFSVPAGFEIKTATSVKELSALCSTSAPKKDGK